jgi:uncharacterized protein YxeA
MSKDRKIIWTVIAVVVITFASIFFYNMSKFAKGQAEDWKKETEWYEKYNKRVREELPDTVMYMTSEEYQKIKDSVRNARQLKAKDTIRKTTKSNK